MEVECNDQGDDQLQDASFINSSSSLSQYSSAIVNLFYSSYFASAQSADYEESDQSIGLLEWIDPSKVEDSKFNSDVWKSDGLFLRSKCCNPCTDKYKVKYTECANYHHPWIMTLNGTHNVGEHAKNMPICHRVRSVRRYHFTVKNFFYSTVLSYRAVKR